MWSFSVCFHSAKRSRRVVFGTSLALQSRVLWNAHFRSSCKGAKRDHQLLSASPVWIISVPSFCSLWRKLAVQDIFCYGRVRVVEFDSFHFWIFRGQISQSLCISDASLLSLCTGVELCFSPSLKVQSVERQQCSGVVCAASLILGGLGHSIHVHPIVPGFLNLCLLQIVPFAFPARAAHVQSPMHGVHTWPKVLVCRHHTSSVNSRDTQCVAE